MQRFKASFGHLTVVLALASAGSVFSPDVSADYASFEFSPEKPYYFEDGKVDFGTYNGFRRYHADCHVCHGPAGMGSSYAPALLESVNTIPWSDFVDVIVRGREGMDNRVMPSFAANPNVLSYIPDIYAYLRARADGVVGTGRPARFPKVKQQATAAR